MATTQRFLKLTFIAATTLALAAAFLLGLEGLGVQAQGQSENFQFTVALFPGTGPTSTLHLAGNISTAGAQAMPLTTIGNPAFHSRNAVYVSPAAFHQAGATPADSFLFWPEGGYLYNSSTSPATPTLLIAPVSLPEGVTLTNFSMVLFDQDPANDVVAVLYRKNLLSNLTGAAEVVMAMGASVADPIQLYQVSTSTSSAGTVLVSDDYSYDIVFQLNPNTGQDQLVFRFSLEYEGGTASSNVEVIPAAAFRHDGDRADNLLFDFGLDLVRNQSNQSVCLVAPLSPPGGATLTELRASLFDHSDDQLHLRLYRLELTTGSNELLAEITSTGTSAFPFSGEQASAPISSTISSSYSYSLSTCFGPGTALNLVLFGARLFYTLPVSASAQAQDLQTRVIPVSALIGAGESGTRLSEVNGWEVSIQDGFLTSDSSKRSCLVAPVYLLVGSTLKSFTVYVEDRFNPTNLTVFFDRTGFLGEWTELSRIISTNGGGVRSLTGITLPDGAQAEVIVPGYNYHLNFCLPAHSGGKLKFYGASITYLAPEPTTDLYFPVLTQPAPSYSTQLFLINLTATPFTYTLFNTAQGDINCTLSGAASAQACGSIFAAGTYGFRAAARCGQKLGQYTYRPISDTLTPFRCE